MVDRRGMAIISINIFAIGLGALNYLLIDNVLMHILYVIAVSTAVILPIFQEKSTWVRPISYLILSFLVFVWMRYVLNVFFNTEIISIGDGVNFRNTSFVAICLGSAMSFICIVSIITEGFYSYKQKAFFESNFRITMPSIIEKCVVLLAIVFFILFLIDSIKKISIVNSSDYLGVSETILVEGYRYFSFGKYLLIIWILLGKDKDRFFKASTILMLAGVGYLMRGARGYAIMYIFLWIIFFSLKHKIKIIPLLILGVALIYLANFILSYRLGWEVASGFKDIVISTLNSQGSSIEPVFGSIIFRGEIRNQFSIYELFTRGDFGLVVDKVRGTGFEMGGFGSSFFAEAFFMGCPLNIIMFLIAGICVGILECAYKTIKRRGMNCQYSQMLLYMTIPNLIYLGRSSVKDFIFKTLITIIIILFLQNMTKNRFLQWNTEIDER